MHLVSSSGSFASPRSVLLLALALQDVLVTAAAACLQFSKLFGKLPAADVFIDVISAAVTVLLFATCAEANEDDALCCLVVSRTLPFMLLLWWLLLLLFTIKLPLLAGWWLLCKYL